MRVIEVTTRCTATVTERWLLHVPDAQAEEAIDEPSFALDLINDEGDWYVLHVEDSKIEDETDRIVVEVRKMS